MAVTLNRSFRIAVAALLISSCTGDPQFPAEETVSPDSKYRAELYIDPDGLGERWDVVSTFGLRRETVARARFLGDARDRLYATWRGPKELEIGIPLTEPVSINQPVGSGVHVTVVPFPNAPAARAFIDSHGGSMSTASNEERAILAAIPDLNSAIKSAVQYRAKPVPKFDVFRMARSDEVTCQVQIEFSADPLPDVATLVLETRISGGNADYSLRFRPPPIRIKVTPVAAELESDFYHSNLLGLRAIGTDELLLEIPRKEDFERALTSVFSHTFTVRFLWDFPDIAAEYSFEVNPTVDQQHKLASCGTQATSEQTFWRTD